MPTATVWVEVPYPEGSLGYGLDAYGTSVYGVPSTGVSIDTKWTEVLQTT